MSEKKLAWYFSESSKRLRYGDDRQIALGVTHTIEGDPIPCEHGLHGSERILDALQYTPGPIVWQVELGGKIVEHEDHDKWAATERTYIRGGIDVTDILRKFARRCALDVSSLWDMPQVVGRYLETGDENIRDAARDAADAAAWAAARDAAWAAAGAAARAAARDAAWAAAWAAAWDAAWAAAWAAAWDAVGAAAWAAAWGAARAAARAAAWAAKIKIYNGWIEEMINEAIDKTVPHADRA